MVCAWVHRRPPIAAGLDQQFEDPALLIDRSHRLRANGSWPRRYGERLLHASDPENQIQVLHQQVSFDGLTAAQLDALERFVSDEIEKQAKVG